MELSNTKGFGELILQVPKNYVGSERVDKYLQDHIQEVWNKSLSRSAIQKLIRNGCITVNGSIINKLGYKVKALDELKIRIEEEAKQISENTNTNVMLELTPEKMDLEIIFEDDFLIVVNKQAGIMVHPSPGHLTGTLVNGLLFHCNSKLSNLEGDPERPGIVHRLDKDTAGLIVIAKDDKAHLNLKEQFQSRKIKKLYYAIVAGKPKDEGGWNRIEKSIARHPKDINKMVISSQGKEAITDYLVLNSWNIKKQSYTLVAVQIHTGRTHQIRVHLSSLGTPIVGDPIYSTKFAKHQVPYLLLVSRYLKFTHPSGTDLEFEINLPNHFVEFLSRTEESKLSLIDISPSLIKSKLTYLRNLPIFLLN